MSSDAVYIIGVSLQLSQHNQHIFGEAAIGTLAVWLWYPLPLGSLGSGSIGPLLHL